MKTLKIYKRIVSERTRFIQYRYKDDVQVTILYDNKKFSNHDVDINNPRLRVKFQEVLNTRKLSDVKKYISCLGRCEYEKFLKRKLNELGF